ncbi:MAG TPA: hypothetical protein VFL84_12840 [Gammaproteobacteria bacterium]|nr:hypothetical protein [Gammaproteobacteria bacterium]
MKLATALLVALIAGTAVHAQNRGSTGPFTGYEAEALSDVWPEIRVAARFEDINWPTHGLTRAPGSPEAQRLLSANWNEIRREERFEDIDWDEYANNRYSQSSRSGDRYGRLEGPFTSDEADALARVWPQIRVAARFEDITWPRHGLERAPGSAEARRLLSSNWDEIRREERFEDIDWDRYYDSRYSSRSDRAERYGRLERGFPGTERDDNDSPFTREEAADLSRVWSEIRQAARFEDINWRTHGLSGPPGDSEARRLTSRYWSELRRAARFEDIDWQTTTGYRAR